MHLVIVVVAEPLAPVAEVGGDHEDVRRVGHVAREDATVFYLQWEHFRRTRKILVTHALARIPALPYSSFLLETTVYLLV